MDDRQPWDFTWEVVAFANRQKSWTDAARQLGISRVGLYRYKAGAMPGPKRLEILRATIEKDRLARFRFSAMENARSSRESVTYLRTLLLHLLRMVELDLAIDDSNGTGPVAMSADHRTG